MNSELKSRSTEDYAHLSRELGFLWWMVLVSGLMEYEPSGRVHVNDTYLATLHPILSRMNAHAEHLSEEALDFHLIGEKELALRMRERRCTLVPCAFQHYVYYNTSQKPMQVWMLKFELHHGNKRPTHQEVLERVWRFVTNAPLVYVDKTGSAISIP